MNPDPIRGKGQGRRGDCLPWATTRVAPTRLYDCCEG